MAETIKTIGIVLKSSKHTIDAARLLDIFSPELGRFSAVIRGVEKPKAKLAIASQPFCFGEFMLSERNGFYTVTDCFVQDSFFSISQNLDSYVLGCSLLEMADKIVQAGESNYEIFMLLLSSLKAIAYDGVDPTIVVIKYIMDLLRISGFGFDIATCDVCSKSLKNEKRAAIVYTGNGAVCLSHAKNGEALDISPAEWDALKSIRFQSLTELQSVSIPAKVLSSCLSIAAKQFYYRVGEKIQSLSTRLK